MGDKGGRKDKAKQHKQGEDKKKEKAKETDAKKPKSRL